jgi:hypothetical protein
MALTIERRLTLLEEAAGFGNGECPLCGGIGRNVAVTVIADGKPLGALSACPGCGHRNEVHLVIVGDRIDWHG